MNKKDELIGHIKRFTEGVDRSVNWGKAAESMLDELDYIDKYLEDFHDQLAFYRPEGGDHLIDERAMMIVCFDLLERLKK